MSPQRPEHRPGHRSRIGRPVRRVRRWARHTPNGEIAVTLTAVGIALLFAAAVIAVAVL